MGYLNGILATSLVNPLKITPNTYPTDGSILMEYIINVGQRKKNTVGRIIVANAGMKEWLQQCTC